MIPGLPEGMRVKRISRMGVDISDHSPNRATVAMTKARGFDPWIAELEPIPECDVSDQELLGWMLDDAQWTRKQAVAAMKRLRKADDALEWK